MIEVLIELLSFILYKGGIFMTLEEIQMELSDLEKRKGKVGIDAILGKGSIMPFNGMNSGSRKLMHTTQVEQILPIYNAEPALVQTGMETLYGEYNSSFKKADCNYDLICSCYTNK